MPVALRFVEGQRVEGEAWFRVDDPQRRSSGVPRARTTMRVAARRRGDNGGSTVECTCRPARAEGDVEQASSRR